MFLNFYNLVQIASDFTKKEKPRWSSGCKVIASCFVDNVTSKEDLSQVVAHMQSTGADILKIVTNANDITELEKMFHLLSHCQVLVRIDTVFSLYRDHVNSVMEKIQKFVHLELDEDTWHLHTVKLSA